MLFRRFVRQNIFESTTIACSHFDVFIVFYECYFQCQVKVFGKILQFNISERYVVSSDDLLEAKNKFSNYLQLPQTEL